MTKNILGTSWSFTSTGTGGTYNSWQPNGLGLPLSYTGTPSQLGTITISTDGSYDFGVRSETSQQWWQVGDRAWDKDGEVTLLEASRSDGDTLTAGVNADAFDTITNLTARKGAKAGLRSGFAYESSLNGQEVGGFSANTSNNPTTTRKAVWGYSGRWTDDLNKIRTSSYGSNTGIFDDGDNANFVAGEAFTGTDSGAGAITGYIIKYDTANSVITFLVNESYSSGGNNGASITGSTSGATATFDGVTYTSVSSLKLTRSSSDPSVTPTNPEVALALTLVSSGQHIVDIRRSDFGSDDERPNNHSMTSSNWESWDFTTDWSGSTYDIASYKAGDVFNYTHTNPNSADMAEVPYDFIHSLFAFDWGGGTNSLGHLFARMKDPYFDYELNRVVLGDSSTFSSCTVTSTCRSDSWSGTSIGAKLNFGEIPVSTETFAFIYNAAGVCVNPTAGLSLGAAP